MCLKIMLFKLLPHLPKANVLKSFVSYWLYEIETGQFFGETIFSNTLIFLHTGIYYRPDN